MTECQTCKDTGMTGYHRPMMGANGLTRMIFTPQICRCAAGEKLTFQYEQNLKNGRAGMYGLPHPATPAEPEKPR